MASLRAARCAFAPGLRQPLGFSPAKSLSQSASLRPNMRPAMLSPFHRVSGVRNLSMGAYVESSIQATGEALVWLNSLTGHWGTTIVFAAFAVAVVRTPLQMITKQILNKQIEAMPLVNAWALQLPRSDRLSEALQLARTRKRLFKERGCQNWKAWAPALGIPIWLLMSETLRRLCGARGGWLSLLSGDYKDPAQPTADAAASLSEQMSPPLSPSLQTISDGLQSLGSTVEAGMANSGWLWFTDLTVADPTMALPGILMLTMGYAMWPRQKEMRNIVFDLGNSKLYMTPGLKWRFVFRGGYSFGSPCACGLLQLASRPVSLLDRVHDFQPGLWQGGRPWCFLSLAPFNPASAESASSCR